MNIVLYIFTALIYCGLALEAWPSKGCSVMRGVKPRIRRGLLLLAFILHGLLLHAIIFPPDAMFFGFAQALSVMFWLGVGIYWIESLFYSLEGMQRFVLPLAAVAALLSLLFPGVRVLPYAANPLFKLHFMVANMAYGLLAIVAAHAVLMLLLERRLHAPLAMQRFPHSSSLIAKCNWLDTLPPLLTLEKLLFRLIAAGFVLLTLALGSGILFSEYLSDRALKFDHKTVFALLSWLMFGAVLIGRRCYGWRGRSALRWVLAAFAALLFAYVGSRFVLEVLLHRAVV